MRNEFQDEAGQFLRSRFKVCFRFDDSYARPRPFDFFGQTKKGKFWVAEVKRVKTHRFPVGNISTNQREFAEFFTEEGGYYWLMINWRELGTGRACWIPWELYRDIEEYRMSRGKRSINPRNFDVEWFLKRITGGWEIDDAHPFWSI